MQVLSPDKRAIEVQVGDGGRIYRAKDGVLDVPASAARQIVQHGGSWRITGFSGARSFRCHKCGFRALMSTRCGRCGQTNLKEEH